MNMYTLEKKMSAILFGSMFAAPPYDILDHIISYIACLTCLICSDKVD